MALIDLEAREVHAKVVYFGPELSGKTTTLRAIATGVPPEARGDLQSIASESARTIFSDSLPVDFGVRFGLRFLWHLYTVPGQPRSAGPRAAVLQGADGVVFVADTVPLRQSENLASFAELQALLGAQGKRLADLAFVLQGNKSDLPGAVGTRHVAALLGVTDRPTFATSAVNGAGVFDALRDISRQVAQRL
ncbi:MAG: ADP-ribosylation factor-like protein [Thermomicrobiales bacterium]|nr:gliding-motility protein MglA [Thermomicrobiales bacterium]